MTPCDLNHVSLWRYVRRRDPFTSPPRPGPARRSVADIRKWADIVNACRPLSPTHFDFGVLGDVIQAHESRIRSLEALIHPLDPAGLRHVPPTLATAIRLPRGPSDHLAVIGGMGRCYT